MLNKAIEKIKAEMDSNKNDSYIQEVGGFLLQHLQDKPNAAEKLASEEKTIKGSLEEMKKIARTKAINGCGMFAPSEGFKIVLKYFGIESSGFKAQETTIEISTIKEKKSDIEFNVELDF